MNAARIVLDMKRTQRGRVELTLVDPDGEAHAFGSIASPAECLTLMPQIAASVSLMLGTLAVDILSEAL